MPSTHAALSECDKKVLRSLCLSTPCPHHPFTQAIRAKGDACYHPQFFIGTEPHAPLLCITGTQLRQDGLLSSHSQICFTHGRTWGNDYDVGDGPCVPSALCCCRPLALLPGLCTVCLYHGDLGVILGVEVRLRDRHRQLGDMETNDRLK